MHALIVKKPRDTGPMELRDFGPTGRRLGTAADCVEDSRWELHRGELWEQMGSKDIHGIVIALLAALFRTHARSDVTVMSDVYCDLSDSDAASLRAPDVALVTGLTKPKDDFFRGTPIIAVEVRGTQSKKYLEEKVKLYLEHDWPCTWIVHTERQEVEVVRPGVASVVYTRAGAPVPLVPELDAHGLRALPVAAFFEDMEARRFNDDWVAARVEAQAVLTVLGARGLGIDARVRARVLATQDHAALGRWLVLAATAPSSEAFVAGME